MKCLLGLACRLRSWQYEIVGIISLSAAVNLFTSAATTVTLSLWWTIGASVAWLALGIQSLWLEGQFRSREVAELSYTSTEIESGELSKRLRTRLEMQRYASAVVCGVIICLLASIVLTTILIINRD